MSHPVENYHFYDDEKYGKATAIDVEAEVASRAGEWFNQNLTTVNDTAVRLSVMKGEYHWHRHQGADEFFLVLEGELCIDFAEQDTAVLGRHCAYTVPMGVTHRTRAPQRAVAIVIEPASTAPAGD
jgi:mannose-6-phosphate isomerase-like protein (cupin superfamily)